jgi:protein-S-isoprenylcysteine O-methyltransferase Ste14
MPLFALVRSIVVSLAFVSIWVWFLPRWLSGPLEVIHPAGALIIAAGSVLAGWCVVEFACRGHGTPAPFDPPRRLVISGPYRFVRNPMYVGLAIILAGEALLTARVWFLAELGVLGLALSLLVRLHEEPALRRAFDDDYRRYSAAVRRWVPRLQPFDNFRPAA